MSTTSYNAVVEFDVKPTADLEADLIDLLVDFHPAAARTPHGRLELIVTLPAETLTQAARTVLALVATLPVSEPVAVQVLTTADFDRRAGLGELPDLVSVTEAAAALKLTRQGVLKQIAADALPALRVGNGWAIPRAALPS